MTINKISALIVDDEPHARKLLQLIIEKYCPEIVVVASCSSTLEARNLVKTYAPAILFLDIEMPEQDGISFLHSLGDHSLYPVLITSHAEYALDAIKAHAFDYLLKPIDPEEFVTCVKKIEKRINSTSHLQSPQQLKQKLALKNVKTTLFVDQTEILAIKASGSYSEVITKEGIQMVSKNLSALEVLLNQALFFRIHNSTILNLTEVTEIIHTGNYAVMSNGDRFVISGRRKEDFTRRMELL